MEKKRLIITTLIVFLSLSIVYLGFFWYANNYNAFYGLPSVSEATLDLKGKSIQNNTDPVRLRGQWEFYYNEFIVTDGQASQKGDVIDVPQKWTNKDYNGHMLPKSGYASYKLTILNPHIGDTFIICNNYADVAFRAFINGKLCFETGKVSKDPSETIISANFDYESFYLVDSQTLEVVIETSSTDGGLFKEPLLLSGKIYSNWDGANWYPNAFVYFTIGIIVVAIIIHILYGALFKGKNLLNTLLLVSLLVHFITTVDIYLLLCNAIKLFKFSYIHIFSIITAFIYFSLMLYTFLKSTIHKNYRLHISLCSVNIVAITLFLIFRHLNLCYLFLLPCLIIMIYYVFMLINQIVNKQKHSVVRLAITLVSLLFVFIEVTDNLGLLEVGTRTVFNYGILILLVLYCLLGFDRIKNIKELINNVESIKNEKLKTEIASGSFGSEVRVITFGQFNIFLNGSVLNFRSGKAKELLALCIDKQGGELTIEEVVTRMYPEKDVDLAKKSYRDNLMKLRTTLKENNIDGLIITERGKISLNKNMITYCDLWEQLENPKDMEVDEYMISYDWGIDTITKLNNLSNENKTNNT